MKKLFAASVIACVSCSGIADDAYMAPLVEKSLLLDIAATDFAVVVGERGHVLVSTEGETFTQLQVPTQSTLTATTIVGDHIWAVGHDAVILHSSDKGATWEIQHYQPELERPFLDVVFFDQQHGIAVGAYGLFYRTRDGGKNWLAERHATLLDPLDLDYLNSIRAENESFYQQELNSILPHINRVTYDSGLLYIAGEAGLLAVSSDLGESWSRYEVDYNGSFFDIKPLDQQSILAVGLRGNIFVKHDEQPWQFINTCSNKTLNSILVDNSGKVFSIGNNGTIIRASRPLPVSAKDPYAPVEQCERAETIEVTQTDDKSALLNGVNFKGKTLVVSADGIKKMNLNNK